MEKVAQDLRTEAHLIIDQMDEEQLQAFIRWYEEDPLTDEEIDALHAAADANDGVPWRQIRNDF